MSSGRHGTARRATCDAEVLDFAEVTLLAMLGTAGALDEDLAIGDVAIASEINEFQANSRAETYDDHYEFR